MFHLIILPLLLGWQIQGSTHQTVQSVRTNYIQAAPAQLQVSQESSDNLQSAMGWRVLEWNE